MVTAPIAKDRNRTSTRTRFVPIVVFHGREKRVLAGRSCFSLTQLVTTPIDGSVCDSCGSYEATI